jgi:hypothetical protein
MLFSPVIEVKAIKRHALGSDRNGGYSGAHLSVEAVLVHTQVMRGVAQSDEARIDAHAGG